MPLSCPLVVFAPSCLFCLTHSRSTQNGGYVGDNKGGCNHSGVGGAPSTDWGHDVSCFNGEAGANNFPLRGGKYSMWEGGIRVNAFVSGGFLPPAVRGTKLDGANAMIHIVDWSVQPQNPPHTHAHTHTHISPPHAPIDPLRVFLLTLTLWNRGGFDPSRRHVIPET